jgi:hypothetical protein
MKLTFIPAKLIIKILLGSILLVGIAGATLPTPLPSVPQTLTANLLANLMNPIAELPYLLAPYTEPLGADGFLLVTGIITFVLFIGVWIRTESALMASVLFIIWAAWQGISNFCPPDWQLPAIGLLVVLPLIAVGYSVARGVAR